MKKILLVLLTVAVCYSGVVMPVGATFQHAQTVAEVSFDNICSSLRDAVLDGNDVATVIESGGFKVVSVACAVCIMIAILAARHRQEQRQ